jgi:hypothetical protein|tara:strand:+ start:6333 stop:6629 length:297 start_codon:yes stop_codon:yes gene_type:complete
MRKRRNIPTIPVDFYQDAGRKAQYQKILYKSIIEGVEQSLNKNKDKFVMARVEDGKSVKDIEILKDAFKTNLETVLNYYEQQEEYELCSRTLNLINQV